MHGGNGPASWRLEGGMRAFRLALTAASLATLAGCSIGNKNKFCASDCVPIDGPPTCGASQINSADVCSVPCVQSGIPETFSPLSIDESILTSENIRALTLEQCIQITLANSTIMRDLGGTVIRAPGTVQTKVNPALTYTDPRLGEEAALSAFDATCS